MITLACCTLHFFVNCKVCQNQWFVMFEHEEIVGFVSTCISIPGEGEKAKATSEEMQDALFKSWIQHNLK